MADEKNKGQAAGGARNPLLEVVFKNRGYDDGYIAEIDATEHGELHDVDRLVAELKTIHDAGEPITIYPDFDMDGIMSGTVLYAGLSELGFDAELYVPDPSLGYGIKPELIDDLMGKHPRTKAIITCDVGITAIDGASRARERGIKFLVTDHHHQTPGELPDALAIVDPMRDDDPYEHPQICGAFVAWQCLMAYARACCDERTVGRINRLRVFSGIGTISDSMPLLYENRGIVRDMVFIEKWLYGDGTAENADKIPGCEPYRKAFRGLHLTLAALSDNGNIRNGADSVDEQTVGFYIAPMFNAVKRMDGDMSRAFGVFFGDQQVSDIDYLIRLNEQRKRIVAAEFDRLPSRTYEDGGQERVRHVYVTDARPGVRGLLGNKVLSETAEPVFVLARTGEGFSGSGRTPEWFPALTLLRDGAGFRLSGHESAFGISIPAEIDGRPGDEAFEEIVSAMVDEMLAQGIVVEGKPDFVLAYDAIDGVAGSGTRGSDVDWDAPLLLDFLGQTAELKPFGAGFPEPRGVLRVRFDPEDVQSIGRDGTHAKMHVNGIDVLCWGQYERFASLPAGRPHACELVGTLSLNEFKGNKTVSFTGDIAGIRAARR